MLLTNLESKHSMVMKFGQSFTDTTEKFLPKCSKKKDPKISFMSFVIFKESFVKRNLGIWESLYIDSETF